MFFTRPGFAPPEDVRFAGPILQITGQEARILGHDLRLFIVDFSVLILKGSHFVVDFFHGMRNDHFAAFGFSILADYPRVQHLVDMKLGEFVEPVVSGLWDPDLVEADILNGETLSFSGLRLGEHGV